MLKPFQVQFKTIPDLEGVLSGRLQINEIRDVEIEDLLERPTVQIDTARISGQLRDKVILVPK
jgi:FlaA1/EpsC-like NDP-sugar epimerase